MTDTSLDVKMMFINPSDKVQPAILAGLLCRNVSLLYQWSQDGRLPRVLTDHSYKECITHLISSLLRAEDVKKAKVIEEARIKEEAVLRKEEAKRSKFSIGDFGGVDDSMHPLMAAKLRQNIKTEYAREADLWQKIAIKRGEYVAFADKLDLVEGLVISIRDTLLHIGNNHPEIQSRVDEAMEELYQLGVILCEESDIDASDYIETMLAKEIDPEGSNE